MAQISFNEPQYGSRTTRTTHSYLGSLVIRLGLATTPSGAQTVLLATALVLLLGIYLVLGAVAQAPLPTIDTVPSPIKQ